MAKERNAAALSEHLRMEEVIDSACSLPLTTVPHHSLIPCIGPLELFWIWGAHSRNSTPAPSHRLTHPSTPPTHTVTPMPRSQELKRVMFFGSSSAALAEAEKDMDAPLEAADTICAK